MHNTDKAPEATELATLSGKAAISEQTRSSIPDSASQGVTHRRFQGCSGVDGRREAEPRPISGGN